MIQGLAADAWHSKSTPTIGLPAWPMVVLKSWLVVCLVALSPIASAQSTGASVNDGSSLGNNGASNTGASGPVRLRQNGYERREDSTRNDGRVDRDGNKNQRDARDGADPRDPRDSRDRRDARDVDGNGRNLRDAPRMSEFEVFVQRLAYPEEVRRFGSDLMTARDDDMPVESNPGVPADYVVKTGDELIVSIWGSVDAELRLIVDRGGKVSLPRVGAVPVAGVKYADLGELLKRRVAQTFRNFDLNVALGQLRGVRVYVTGHVARPGAYGVTGLGTMTQALMRAGGPAASGSFRSIQLRRGGQTVATFDLYDLLLKGDRGADRPLQADDVIHVGPVGREVALIGSVNRPAIFELTPQETVSELLAMAGGYSAVADRSRLAIERLSDRSSTRITQLEMPTSLAVKLDSGDVVRAFSAVDATLPVQRQNKRIRIEGEVVRPGDYVLPPQSSLADALAVAGGLTSAAYPFGTEFMRESVRLQQQINYDRALRDLETEFARYNTGQRTMTAEDAAAQTARSTATARLVDRMRAVRPTGRVVLQLPPDGRDLPALALEDGDRLYVPPRPTSVGVFGSVFNGGSYLYSDGREVEDFLKLAGGPTRGADPTSIFVIRANGSVVSSRAKSSWMSRENGLTNVRAEAGDTIFVPEEMDKTTFTQHAKDWGQIVSQFGLGLAAIIALTR